MSPRKSSETGSSSGTDQRTPINGSAHENVSETFAACCTPLTTPMFALSVLVNHMKRVPVYRPSVTGRFRAGSDHWPTW